MKFSVLKIYRSEGRTSNLAWFLGRAEGETFSSLEHFALQECILPPPRQKFHDRLTDASNRSVVAI